MRLWRDGDLGLELIYFSMFIVQTSKIKAEMFIRSVRTQCVFRIFER